MTGIEVLVTEEVATEFAFNWSEFWIAFGIIFGTVIRTVPLRQCVLTGLALKIISLPLREFNAML